MTEQTAQTEQTAPVQPGTAGKELFLTVLVTILLMITVTTLFSLTYYAWKGISSPPIECPAVSSTRVGIPSTPPPPFGIAMLEKVALPTIAVTLFALAITAILMLGGEKKVNAPHRTFTVLRILLIVSLTLLTFCVVAPQTVTLSFLKYPVHHKIFEKEYALLESGTDKPPGNAAAHNEICFSPGGDRVDQAVWFPPPFSFL